MQKWKLWPTIWLNCRRRRRIDLPLRATCAALLGLGGLSAGADNTALAADEALYQSECAACHIAFPPRLLSRGDWQAIVSDLENHFGTNAGVDAAVRDRIAQFLAQSGAVDRTDASRDATLRITTAAWFVRKHRGAARLVNRGRLASLSDCAACHKDAGDLGKKAD
jgi:mono/diheme cytochrome c family protein